MRHSWMVLVGAATLLMAACGDGDEAGTPTSTPARTGTPGIATATPTPRTSPDTSQDIGDVDDVSSLALLDEREASENDDIHPGSIIQTDESGTILFHTDDVAGCDIRSNSLLQIRPDDRLAIKWLGTSGTSFCNKEPGQGRQIFGVGDRVEILLEDPIFGVALQGDETVIKLVSGSATVTLTDISDEISLKANQELVVPPKGRADKPRRLELSIEERAIVSRWETPTPTPTPPPATPTLRPTSILTPSPLTPGPPSPTPTPTAPAVECDPSYPDVCIPPSPPDLDCRDIPHSDFMVRPPDPHGFDRDGDGIGCETLS